MPGPSAPPLGSSVTAMAPWQRVRSGDPQAPALTPGACFCSILKLTSPLVYRNLENSHKEGGTIAKDMFKGQRCCPPQPAVPLPYFISIMARCSDHSFSLSLFVLNLFFFCVYEGLSECILLVLKEARRGHQIPQTGVTGI